jgi:hypothetical protein
MPHSHDSAQSHPSARGFTIVETLAVVGVIALLLAILLPAINVARRNALWGTSQANLRQIGQLLVTYAGDNRDAVVPTAFDYAPNLTATEIGRAGKVRSASPPTIATPPIGKLHAGSWCDILWTYGGFGPVGRTDFDPATVWDYRYDSPDATLYNTAYSDGNVFRSAEPIYKAHGGSGATPHGTGATADEEGQPGYFGGNPFFDARPPVQGSPYYQGKYRTMGQIKAPEQSMYCADSNIGELLAFNSVEINPDNEFLNLTGVEFRYSGEATLMLFLDGHVDSYSEWENLFELEKDLKVRVLDLDKNRFYPTN